MINKFALLLFALLLVGCQSKDIVVNPGIYSQNNVQQTHSVTVELVQETISSESGEPLGSLNKGLLQYMSFDNHLLSINNVGVEQKANFSRESLAFGFDMKPYAKMEPRFMEGRFGSGIFIEYGNCTSDPAAGRNFLPAAIASADKIKDHFKALGSAEISKTKGLEGDNALLVKAMTKGSGFESTVQRIPLCSLTSLSMYVKGKKGQILTAGMKGLIEKQFTLNGNWQRLVIDCLDRSKEAIQSKGRKPRNVIVYASLSDKGTFSVDALMLEVHVGGYSHRSTASSWVPGERLRKGEILKLASPVRADKGSVSLWFKTLGRLKRRRLFSIGDDHGWKPEIAVDLMRDIGFGVIFQDGGVHSYNASKMIKRGDWNNVVVTWNKPDLYFYLNGQQLFHVNEYPDYKRMGVISIGGAPTSFSPGLRSDAIIDDFAVWSRPLSKQEVATLFKRKQALSAGFDTAITFVDFEPLSVFARDFYQKDWIFGLKNRTNKVFKNVELEWGILDYYHQTKKQPLLAANALTKIPLMWHPAFLKSGNYTFFVNVKFNGNEKLFLKDIAIAPARVPFENLQIVAWADNNNQLKDMGITCAGIGSSTTGPARAQVDQAVKNGLYTMIRQTLYGKAESFNDFFLELNGKRLNIDQRETAPLKDVQRKCSELAGILKYFPDIRYIILNTEKIWVWNIDFRRKTIDMVKTRFGLDLSKWLNVASDKRWKAMLPNGRLAPSIVNYPKPENGIIPLNDPLYAFERWWHSDQVGNEIFLNDYIAKRIRRNSPWMNTISEPALRRPFVRAFKQQSILQEWFYYENPISAILIQETLTAAKKGTQARIAGMPQFLFKPGGAAPYKATPAPDMFREAVWHCLSRPLRQFSFWGLWMIMQPGKNSLGNKDIEVLLKKRLKPGEKYDFDTVKSKIKIQEEQSEFDLYIPELKEEVKRIHKETLHPLGNLLVNWKNKPRKMAVYLSFAGQIYSEKRWSSIGGLFDVMCEIPMPYDVLFDQDFEADKQLLNQYDVLLIPECPALIKPAAEQIKTFIKKGAKVIVDDYFKANLPGIVKFKWQGTSNDDFVKIEKQRTALLNLYGRPDHPQFIEGMEKIAAEFSKKKGPINKAVELINFSVNDNFKTKNKKVYYNILEAEGATYLTVVNGLRTNGPYFGKFDRVQEKGVPQNAAFSMTSIPGKAVYDLLAHKPVKVSNKTMTLALAPCGGKVLLFLPEAITTLRADISTIETSPYPGPLLRIKASLSGSSSKLVSGIIPVKITVTRPDLKVDSFSHYDSFKRGKLCMDIPIPLNGQTGEWTITIQELASGKTIEKTIKL